jgi:hypothetical protein
VFGRQGSLWDVGVDIFNVNFSRHRSRSFFLVDSLGISGQFGVFHRRLVRLRRISRVPNYPTAGPPGGTSPTFRTSPYTHSATRKHGSPVFVPRWLCLQCLSRADSDPSGGGTVVYPDNHGSSRGKRSWNESKSGNKDGHGSRVHPRVCTRGCGRVRVRVAILDPCSTRIPDPCTRGFLNSKMFIFPAHRQAENPTFTGCCSQSRKRPLSEIG